MSSRYFIVCAPGPSYLIMDQATGGRAFFDGYRIAPYYTEGDARIAIAALENTPAPEKTYTRADMERAWSDGAEAQYGTPKRVSRHPARNPYREKAS